MSPYMAADHDSSSDADGEVDDIMYGGPYQYPDHEVMGQQAADGANNPAQTEQDLEDSLRRFLGGYENESPHRATTARAHAPAICPAIMVPPTSTVSSSTAFAYTPTDWASPPTAVSATSPTQATMGSAVAGLAYWRSLDSSCGAGGQAYRDTNNQAAPRSSSYHYPNCSYHSSQPCHHEQALQAHEDNLQAREERLEAEKKNVDAWALHISDMKRSREIELRGTAEKLAVREHKVKQREKAIVRRERRLVRTCLKYRDAYKMMNRQCDTLDAIIVEQDADKAKDKELTMKQLEDECLNRVRLPR